MIVKPKTPNFIVRDPLTHRPLSPEGQEIVVTSYWLRRLQDGDVVEVASQSPMPSIKEAQHATEKKHKRSIEAQEDD